MVNLGNIAPGLVVFDKQLNILDVLELNKSQINKVSFQVFLRYPVVVNVLKTRLIS